MKDGCVFTWYREQHESLQNTDDCEYLRKENQRLAQELGLLKLSLDERSTLLNATKDENKEQQSGLSCGAAQCPEDDSAAVAQRIDRSYFDSYSQFEIHREMLGDKVSHLLWWAN